LAAGMFCTVVVALLLAVALSTIKVRGAGRIPAPGTKVTSTEGPCLAFNGLRDAVIEDVIVGPCAGNGIELIDSHNVTVRGVTVSGTAGSGIYVVGSSSISIEESRVSGGVSGIYAVSSTSVQASCNTIENPRGPAPRGQLVQFDKVTGPG